MDMEPSVTLARQLEVATDIDACFCVGCGQPDEPDLHDPARCPGRDGKLDTLTIADALEAYDQSCEELPELDNEARALHCAILAVRQHIEKQEGPRIGDGSIDAAVAIGEHAFRAGFEAAVNAVEEEGLEVPTYAVRAQLCNQAWDAYDPPEDIKALS